MKRRPKGTKYQNLYRRRGGVIYYEKVVGTRPEGRSNRVKLSTNTDNWDEAAKLREAIEDELRKPAKLPFCPRLVTVPT